MKKLLFIIFFKLFLFGFIGSLFVDGKAPEDLNNLQWTIHFHYKEKVGKIDSNTFYSFFENINYIYLDLVPKEHISMEIKVGEKISSGALVLVKEKIKTQNVEHLFQIKIDKEKNTITWISPNTKIYEEKWKINMEVAVIVIFKLEDENIITDITVGFGSNKDLKASVRVNTKEIWDKHNFQEIHNALTIYQYLIETQQIYNNPTTWDIEGIRDNLIL